MRDRIYRKVCPAGRLTKQLGEVVAAELAVPMFSPALRPPSSGSSSSNFEEIAPAGVVP